MEKEQVKPAGMLENFITQGTPERIRERYRLLPELAARTDFGILDADTVVLDTETTGVSFKHDELIQIAAARMQSGKIVDWYVTFVNPKRPIPGEISHLTGIRDADVAKAPSPKQALSGLVEFVGKSMIVAHNAPFDRHFTTKDSEGSPLLSNTWIDTLDLARIAVPRLSSHRLLDLVRAFGAPLSTHRADDDVAATCAVYRILLAGVASMPPEVIDAIADMASPAEWPTVEVFRHFASTQRAPFSLLKLRRDRVDGHLRKARADAEALALDPQRGLRFPEDAAIVEAFEAKGFVGSSYEGYELREEQRTMAVAVNDAFSSSTNLVVEAGTGVGKSMAYLLPSAMLARENGITVGIATKTNALLDQLVNKELPLLDKALGGVSFMPLKGISHYPCLRSIGRMVDAGPRVREVNGQPVHQAPALAGVLSFVEQSEYDDIDTLKVDYRSLPRYLITTTSHDCLRRKCPFFGAACFAHGARARAEASDIVVTNHSLMFCDIAADGGLLPPIRHWVVDEAHGVEGEARRAFSEELVAEDILRIASHAASDEPSRNVFLRAQRRIAKASQPTLESSLIPQEQGSGGNVLEGGGITPLLGLLSKARNKGKAFEAAAREFCVHLKDLLYFDAGSRGKGYERVELWLNDDIRASDTFKAIVAHGRLMCDEAEKLITTGQEIVGFMEGVEGVSDVQREVAALVMDLRDVLRACEVILFDASPLYAYAAHLNKKRDRVGERLEALLVNVGEKVDQTLFENTHSVIFTSATLTIDGSFASFEGAMGLNATEGSKARDLELASSYDFDENMRVYVVKDMPDPREASYLEKLQRLLIDVHRAQGGATLTLFTNRRDMERCFDVVAPALKGDDLRLVCQKWGVSIKGLRDEFLADENLSLFALKSFWEGFDAPGDTLRTVVIPKLPFGKPTDALSCERAQNDPQAWSRYVLPQAVLETKQAAGRLIRTSTDSGDLILADSRLVAKGYGRTFLNSLPSKNVSILTECDIVAALRASR